MIADLETWAGLLRQALQEPLGLLLRVSDFDRARARLYAARAKFPDPEFQSLAIRRGPQEGTLMIVRGGQRAPHPQELAPHA